MSQRAPSFSPRPAAGLLSATVCGACLYRASSASSQPVALAIWIGAAVALAGHVWAETRARRHIPVPSFPALVLGRVGEALILVLAGYSNDWVVKLAGIPLGWVAAWLVGLACFTRLFRSGTWPAEGMARFKLAWSVALFAAILGAGVESQLQAEGVVAERAMQAGLSLVGLIALAAVMKDGRAEGRGRAH